MQNTMTASPEGRPIPDDMRRDGQNTSSTYRWWTKNTSTNGSQNMTPPDRKEIRSLEDNAVIRFVRRGLRVEEAQASSDERKAFVLGIMRRLKDESIWPAFAKTCRYEYQQWLAWCMSLRDEGAGDDGAGDE